MAIGKVLRPHGVRGEMRVDLFTDYPERLSHHSTLYVDPDFQPHTLEKTRLHKGVALVKLEGYDDRSMAETMRGRMIYIPREEAVPLEEDEYYHFQLEGLTVITEGGEDLGKLAEVLETGANDVYIVRGTWGEILLPAIEGVILDIDLTAERMTVKIPPGLLEEK